MNNKLAKLLAVVPMRQSDVDEVSEDELEDEKIYSFTGNAIVQVREQMSLEAMSKPIPINKLGLMDTFENVEKNHNKTCNEAADTHDTPESVINWNIKVLQQELKETINFFAQVQKKSSI